MAPWFLEVGPRQDRPGAYQTKTLYCNRHSKPEGVVKIPGHYAYEHGWPWLPSPVCVNGTGPNEVVAYSGILPRQLHRPPRAVRLLLV